MLKAHSLVNKLSPELTLESFHGSLGKLTVALHPLLAHRITRGLAASVLPTITMAVNTLTESERAWSRERTLQADIERLTQERDAALASYAQRAQGGLDNAETRLRVATENRDRLRQERATAWRTAEGLVKEASRLAEDTAGSKVVQPR